MSKKEKDSEGGMIYIDTSRLETPPYAGFANRCVIERFEEVVTFSFFERRAMGPDIGVARIMMTIDDIALRLWPSSEDLAAGLDALFPTLPSDLLLGPVPSMDLPGGQANILSLTRTGLSASFEFHYVTPRSLLWANKTSRVTENDLELIPVTAVQSTVYLATAVFRQLRTMVPGIVAELRGIVDFSKHPLLKL